MQKGIHVLLWLLTFLLAGAILPARQGAFSPLLDSRSARQLLLGYQKPFVARSGSPARVRARVGRVQVARPPRPKKATVAAPPPSHTWAGFMHRLHELEQGRLKQVRVLHLGDSELFADGPSGAVRTLLQKRYGNAGLGFAAPVNPLPWYLRAGWKHRKGVGFSAYPMTQGKRLGGFFGPAGIAYEGAPGARARVDLMHPKVLPCTVEFHYAMIPRGGSVALWVDGRLGGEVDTDRWKKGIGVWRKRYATCPQKLEVRVKDRHAIIYGWNVAYDQAGILWSCLGVLSAQFAHFRNYDSGHLATALGGLRPDLVVFTYGLNQAALEWPPAPTYGEGAAAAMRQIRKALPVTACLVTSPYPVGFPKRGGGFSPEAPAAEKVTAYLRRAAKEAGCAFLDRYHRAGGIKAARRWVRVHPRIMGGDFQHLTKRGAALMGQRIAESIVASEGDDELGEGIDFALEKMR